MKGTREKNKKQKTKTKQFIMEYVKLFPQGRNRKARVRVRRLSRAASDSDIATEDGANFTNQESEEWTEERLYRRGGKWRLLTL